MTDPKQGWQITRQLRQGVEVDTASGDVRPHMPHVSLTWVGVGSCSDLSRALERVWRERATSAGAGPATCSMLLHRPERQGGDDGIVSGGSLRPLRRTANPLMATA